MASVKDYYPGDFWGDTRGTLAWLTTQQNLPLNGWQGNALGTQTTEAFAECGLSSTPDLSLYAQSATECIVIDPPVGVLPDTSVGPDGFPINFSPLGLPSGNLLLNVFQNAAPQTVSGRCLSLLQDLTSYRVDVFSRTDQFYFQGSSVLTSAGSGTATWSLSNVQPGAVVAVLYPTSVPPPTLGAKSPALPSGWIAHSNTGVGFRLSDYFARVYSKTDVEYLQEDQVPICVQDAHHARVGSSVVPAPGTLTVHVVYNDPVAGPIVVFTSLQGLAAYSDLPRSFTIPTSDPLFVQDVTATNTSSLQNRSFIYDDALAILVFAGAGNFAAAGRIISRLNTLLDNPGYLASQVLENGEDGNSAQRWKVSRGTDSVLDVNDPAQPPYGNGLVVQFTAAQAGDSFIYSGSGLPDSTDPMIQWSHKEAADVSFAFTIGITTAAGAVTTIQVTSDPAGVSTWNAAARTITVPIGEGSGLYRTETLDLAGLVATLASDTFESTTNFAVAVGTAGGALMFDNLSVGGLQPTDSLSFSYDVYYGQVDQAYIRTGAMAWVAYAYAVYMTLSLDFSPSLYLQRLLNFLLTLQSTAPDLTNGLLTLGYGRYQDPGYQFVPGWLSTASTEHNVDAYFALQRAAQVLPTAATQLLKLGAITAAQATSLNASAGTYAAAAGRIASQLLTKLYIGPGADPGHFAQGATGNLLDSSQALDAAGTWAAMFCHAAGDDTKAAECLKFAYQKFYLTGQTVVMSNSSGSWNQAYQQAIPFSGFKPYNDSPGGYSGAPASIWEEGTWGMILALVRLHDVPGVADYFASVAESIDQFLTTLIADRYTVRSITGDGSILGYSLAARDLPWEFEVWPMLAPSAWCWLVSVNPGLLLSLGNDAPQTLPFVFIPDGLSQSVNELDGTSSVGQLEVETIDPSGTLKSLMAQQQLVGQTACFRMGFPNLAFGDFTTLHAVTVTSTGFTADGRLRFTCADPQRFVQGSNLWENGGPDPWTTAQLAPLQPRGRAWLPNAFAVSDQNPRWLSGNPLDLYLAALQNELGVGQDPSAPPSAWRIYKPGDDSTLLNPNSYLDVPGILALRDGAFSGDWFEFKITRPVEAKQWLEDQILKVLGLYTIVRSDGRLALKSMKSPQIAAPVMALNERNTVGLPELSRLPVINVVTVRMGVDDTGRETAARNYSIEVSFQQTTSINQFRQQFKQQVEANGLRVPYGGMLRASLLADRIFRRHAFATPRYAVKTHLAAVIVELGDFVWFNHPLVPDLLSGGVGLNNVVCEVVGRQPHYADGFMEFDLLDTRFMQFTTPYAVAPSSAKVPSWSNATAGQQEEYLFISPSETGAVYNTIF